MSITFDQLLEALEIDEACEDKEDKIEEACEDRVEESLNESYGIEHFINSTRGLSEEERLYLLLDYISDEDFERLARNFEKAGQVAADFVRITDDSLDEAITDKGDLGPEVLAELEKVVNNNTKFSLDSDPDGKIILTDPRQLKFKVDIDNDNFVLLDSNGKVIIKAIDPKEFIKKIMVFITD